MKAQLIATSERVNDFKIALPWPAPELFPNRSNGHHWAVNSEAKRIARESACWQAMGHLIGSVTIDHRVTILIEPPDRRFRDVDGVHTALKSTLDGLADGLEINDWHFNPVEIWRGNPVKDGRITIIVHGATA